jgi:hypothetical protein
MGLKSKAKGVRTDVPVSTRRCFVPNTAPTSPVLCLYLHGMVLYLPYSVRQKLTIRQKLTKVLPKKCRKETPDSKTARGSRSITGRGFQIVLSRNLVEQAFPSKNAVEFLRMRTWRTWRTSNMPNFNCIFEGEGLLYEISRQNNLESPPRD